MTNKQAAFLLGAARPDGSDSANPEFAEALDQASRDPVLRGWYDDQRRFDASVAARLSSVAPPAGLRERILAGGRVSRPAPWYRRVRSLALAAMVMLAAGLGIFYTVEHRRQESGWEAQALAGLSDLLAGRETFEMKSGNVAELQQWLRTRGAPSAGDIPASLQGLASLGCRRVSWDGHEISLICFHGPDGELVHLAMMDRAALSNPPPNGHPEYKERDGWRLACWSQGSMAMMLATRGSEDQLHTLLGVSLF